MFDPMRQKTRENYIIVTFPDYPSLEAVPFKVEIIQAIGSHDIAVMYFADTVPVYLEGVATGAPVNIEWKNDKVSGSFYGYKADSVYQSSIIRKKRTTLTFIGVSYPLKENEDNIWVNKTASEIVLEIAKKFKLKPMITPHPIRWSQQSMVGQSYWEKLRELADRVGYAFQVQGSELHFHPIDKMIDKSLSSMPVMSFSEIGAEFDAVYNSRTLEYFEPKITDYNESIRHRKTEKIIRGVDPLTGKVYSNKTSPTKVGKKFKNKVREPLFSQIETSTVIGSRSMAEALSKAKADLSRFSVTAIGAGQGDPRIAPWRLIDVRQTEEEGLGLWVVKSVTHTILRDYRYYVEFECMTDGTGELTSGDRVSKTSQQPTVNLATALEFGNIEPSTSTTLNSQSTIINQADTGFKVTPRRWESN